ncbi:trimeric intracellular cation channel family protein [Gordonia lacunae]|uniref:Glycine transporter domain-containing protein n=1 Tax=Gordonia lacunae TaxID=417102 RepID=A0A243Q5D8_9ACTN|nr:trimeric intracellular cation channel family protein [Gordonia lacunae]OUC76643.1 hypothetical protein CA982_21285 [Gordonia lacunae]
MLLDVLNFAGIAVFAASGAMLGVRKDFDMWGIITVGVLTGVGGGVLRDVLLGITPPASINGWGPIVTATVASLVVFFFHPAFTALHRSILVLDAFGMGLFAATGASIALDVGASAFAATTVGLLTAVGGGMLRDVISNEIPLLLQPSDLYAVPAVLGAAIVAVGATYTSAPHWIWLVVGSVLATGLRLVSLRFALRLPTARR